MDFIDIPPTYLYCPEDEQANKKKEKKDDKPKEKAKQNGKDKETTKSKKDK